MQFYEKIRELREDHDIKQETMADLLGVGQSYYSKQERGLKPFQVEQIITFGNIHNRHYRQFCSFRSYYKNYKKPQFA